MPSVELLSNRQCTKGLMQILGQVPARFAVRAPMLLDDNSMWTVLLWTMLRWERTFLMIGLEDQGVDVWALSREVDELIESRRRVGQRLTEMNVAPSAIHQSPAAIDFCLNRLLDQVQAEARTMGHAYLGSEHLLLAIISTADSSLSSILSRHGVTKGRVTQMLEQLPTGNSPPCEAVPVGPYRRDEPHKNSFSFTSWDSEAAGVPRRFGMSIMFMIMTMYALLFAFMQVMGTPPAVFAFIAIFVTGIGFAQMALFGGRYPRAASIWAGAILLPVEIFVSAILFAIYDGGHVGEGIAMAFVLAILSVPFGAFFGYLAGGLTAGAFLLVDMFGPKEQPADAELVPEDDSTCGDDAP